MQPETRKSCVAASAFLAGAKATLSKELPHQQAQQEYLALLSQFEIVGNRRFIWLKPKLLVPHTPQTAHATLMHQLIQRHRTNDS